MTGPKPGEKGETAVARLTAAALSRREADCRHHVIEVENARHTATGEGIVTRALLIIYLLVFAGCATTEPDLARRPPAMPTVGEAPPAVSAAARDQRVRDAALAAARERHIDTALASLAEIRDPAVRARITGEVVHSLVEVDTAAAAALAVTLPAGPVQNAGLELAARSWAARDPVAALRWAVEIRDAGTAAVAQRAVAEAGIARDPRALIERLETLEESPAKADLRAVAAAAWARRDPELAIEWMRAQRDESRLRPAVAFAVAETNPGRAISLADQVPEGRDRWLLLTMIGQTWVAQDRPAAMEWAGRLSVSAERDAAFAGIETGLGVPSSRRRGGGPGQRTILSRGAGGGSAAPLRPEFADFAAWLATQPPERDREEAMLEFVRQRGALDTGAMGQWLASLPGSTMRDRALEIYLEGRLTSTPAEAAAWLRSLPRSDVNDAMVDQVARRWLRSDPDAAATWLRDLAIPEFQKDRLLREAGR